MFWIPDTGYGMLDTRYLITDEVGYTLIEYSVSREALIEYQNVPAERVLSLD
jgi:hypothetical protein